MYLLALSEKGWVDQGLNFLQGKKSVACWQGRQERLWGASWDPHTPGVGRLPQHRTFLNISVNQPAGHWGHWSPFQTRKRCEKIHFNLWQHWQYWDSKKKKLSGKTKQRAHKSLSGWPHLGTSMRGSGVSKIWMKYRSILRENFSPIPESIWRHCLLLSGLLRSQLQKHWLKKRCILCKWLSIVSYYCSWYL